MTDACSAPCLVRGAAPAARGIAGRIAVQLLAACGPGAKIIAMAQRDWASVTFTGTRYGFRLALPAGAIAPDLDALAEHEFRLVGVIVADCAASLASHERDAAGRAWVIVAAELLTIADN